MTRHHHVWLLGRVTAERLNRFACVRYSCACGKRNVVRTGSTLVVATARLRAKQ